MARKRKGENQTDANISTRDRVLLALKPYSIDAGQLYDCIPGASSCIVAMLAEGLIERSGRGVDAIYKLTDQGRRAVPKRRELLKAHYLPEASEGMCAA